MAEPGGVKFTYREVSSSDKELHFITRINGSIDEYGHDDIAIGKNARKDVYPQILTWLKNHSSTSYDDTTLLMKPTPPGDTPPDIYGGVKPERLKKEEESDTGELESPGAESKN
jgi:hypothetical protein